MVVLLRQTNVFFIEILLLGVEAQFQIKAPYFDGLTWLKLLHLRRIGEHPVFKV